MVKKRRGLGDLGVDVLLSAASTSRGELEASSEDTMKPLPVESILRGKYQPRLHIHHEALQELAESIRAHGLVQPVVVRPVAGGFELIAGERRWRAAKLAGVVHIPAIIKSVPDQAAAAMCLIENIQREDLNPLEEAGALQRLIEEFGLTHQEIAQAIGRSRAAVSNLLRLLELGEETKKFLEAGELEMGHARALLALAGPQQADAARYVVAKSLSVRETERYVKVCLDARPKGNGGPKDPNVIQLERSLSDTLGTKVDVRHTTKGRGRLVIQYNSLEELDGILSHIK
jgi:ParB family transcriptional regulator, chromosome partitioning protein